VMSSLRAMTHPSPHTGREVAVPTRRGARYKRSSSRGPTALRGGQAHAAVEPDRAFVERLHAQLNDAFSRTRDSAGPDDVRSPMSATRSGSVADSNVYPDPV
jgi:hypothetical protein